MALPVNIDDLVNHRKVEWARIEYKEGWNPEKVLHSLCAFANDIDNWGGGYVILGVAEKDGKPVFPVKGLSPDSIDRIQKELLGVCHLIEPLYLPVVEPVEYQEKMLLVIWAPGGVERPYKCPEHLDRNAKSPKSYYIRKMANTVKATRAEEKALFDLAGDVPFDDRLNMHADVTDLKMNLIVDYLHEVGSDLAATAEEMSVADLARNMQIAAGPVECFKPKNVGLLFFNYHPENFFRCAWIEVVDKPDPTGEGMVEQSFKGPLHVQLRAALDYIRNRFLREKIFKYDDRPEAGRFWNYPYRAIEEALANAVYHKSYQIAEPITVVVTPEAMTISSLPGPERSISDADLAACRMIGLHYRNRRIGDFLKELDLVEGRNTGVPVIVNVMRRNGSPMPVFSSPENRDWLSVTLPINPHFCEMVCEMVCEMKNPISQTTAQKTALKTALKTGEIAPERPKVAPEIAPEKSAGGASSRTISKENRAVLQDNGHVVSVITAEEELEQIEIALKIALEIAPKRFRVQKSKKIRERMAQIIQCLLRNRRTSIADLVAAMNVSLRTLRADISLLRKIKVLKRIGADKNGSWDVLLDYGRNR